jgi:hypothetical protein
MLLTYMVRLLGSRTINVKSDQAITRRALLVPSIDQ